MSCFRQLRARYQLCNVIFWTFFAPTYLSNLIKGSVLCSTDDLTTIAYDDIRNQLSNEELGVGTSTLLLLTEFQDEVEGTPIETRFFSSIRLFYQETVRKMFAKFPFKDPVLSDLSLLDPRQREHVPPASVVRLCSRFSLLTQVINGMIFLVNFVTLEQHWMNVYLRSISQLLTAPGLSNFGWQ